MPLVSGRSANRLQRTVVQIGEHLHLSELLVDVSYILRKLDHKSAGSIFCLLLPSSNEAPWWATRRIEHRWSDPFLHNAQCTACTSAHSRSREERPKLDAWLLIEWMAEEDKGEGNHANAERFEPGKKDVKLQSIDGLVKQKQTTRHEICQRGIGDLERGSF